MPKRRTRGDGGLYQRHDHPSCPPRDDNGDRPEHRCRGRWVATVNVKIEGKPKARKYIYGRTQADAKRQLALALRQKEEGSLVLNNETVATWLMHWLKIAARTLKPQTLRGYQSKVETLIIPHLGDIKLRRLTPEMIEDWHDTLKVRGSRTRGPLSDASVKHAHVILSKALSVAVERKRLAYNPVDRAAKPRVVAREERDALTVEQAAKILDGANARWWLAVFYGMRQGEALGLRWRDIDFDAGTLSVRQTLQMDGNKPTFGPPKTKRSRRTIPLLPPVALALKLHQPAGIDPDALVFSDNGQPRMPWTDNRDWHRHLAAAHVPDVPLHAARNTAASVLEAAGVPDRLVMQILGHSQVKQTHDYTRAELARVRQALQDGLDVLAIEAAPGEVVG